MNLESGLITSIETKEDLLLVLSERITEDFFDEHKEVYNSIIDYYKKYSTVPEKETLKSLFPNFQFSDSNEPLKFFIDKIKDKHKKNLYTKGLVEVAELMKSNIDEAEKKLQKLVTSTRNVIRSGVDMNVRAEVDKAKEAYLKRKDALGIDGYSTPWNSLNNLTCGYHKGELIVWTARPKMCKTFLLIEQARHIWREHNVPIVFVTKEMSQKAIMDRLYALECRLPFGALRSGMLSNDQQKAYFDYLDKLEEEEKNSTAPFIVTGYDLADGLNGVSSFIPKIEQHLMGEGVLFVDGLYLLPDDRGEKDWKAIVNISMDLKNLALQYNIPIVATTQHNMEGKSEQPRFDGVAYGKYLVQFVDGLIGISRTKIDRDFERGRIWMLGQREGDIGDFPINMKFNPLDFSEAQDKTVKYEDDEDDAPVSY